MRVAIAGGCRCGKTTLSERYTGTIRHTDDLIATVSFPDAADAVCRWFEEPFDVIEGALVMRGLRRWLDKHPQGKPCDTLIIMFGPYVELTPQQRNYNRGLRTIFQNIKHPLSRRGVTITELPRQL